MHCWRITPDNCLVGTPCSVTAMACANAYETENRHRIEKRYTDVRSLNFNSSSLQSKDSDVRPTDFNSSSLQSKDSDIGKYYSDELKDDGYLSLDGFNRMVRKFFPVKKKLYFKRNERPTLQDYLTTLEDDAFICVRGHYIYADAFCDGYWSFFDNATDPVICAWLLAWISDPCLGTIPKESFHLLTTRNRT